MDLKDSKTKQKTPIITYTRHGAKNQLWIAKASRKASYTSNISFYYDLIS